MKRTTLLVSAILACFAAVPAAAQRTGNFVDAAQFQIDDPMAYTLAVGGSSQQRLAQTMTVEVGGKLAGVFIPMACAAGKITVELRDVDKGGLPGFRLLAVAHPHASDLDLFRFTYVEMRSRVSFSAGDRVAIIVSNDGGSCGYAPAPAAVAYAGGQGFYESLPNPPGWVSFSSTGSPDDLAFQLVLQ